MNIYICEYLIRNNNEKLQCLVRMQVLSVPKEFNLERHTPHCMEKNSTNVFDGESRVALVNDF
jgi:hypothetical protein